MIDTPNFLFIVLELAEGGELFDKVKCGLFSMQIENKVTFEKCTIVILSSFLRL